MFQQTTTLVTKVNDTFKFDDGISVGKLKKILDQFPDDLDIRIEAINGEEILETVESNASWTEDQTEYTGYKYLLLKALDVDVIHTIMNEEFEALTALRQAYSDFYLASHKAKNNDAAKNAFIDSVGNILEEWMVENELS